MTPLKLARIKICEKCSERTNGASQLWPRCKAGNMDLTDDAFNGNASDCPKGLWDDIKPELLDEFMAIPKRFADGAPQPPVVPAWQTTAIAERSAICDACDVETCALKKCKGCRKRNLLARPNMACPADPPKWGPIAPPRLNVVWTISAWNEGDWPRITVADLIRSVAGADFDFDVIVVDDGSTDGSCDNLPCHVLTNPRPLGIGHNLNLAAGYAIRELGADVVGVADAHMLHPPGAIEAVAKKAAAELCIATSASAQMGLSAPANMRGARLVNNSPKQIVAAEWLPATPQTEEWAISGAPLGACYAMSRETIGALSRPTGRLWETVVGRWGFLVEPMAIKAALLGIPVYVSRDHATCHLYRLKNANPTPNVVKEKVRNMAFATGAIFHEGTWEKWFKRWCSTRKRVGAAEVVELAAAGRRDVVLPWSIDDEEMLLSNLPLAKGK